MATGEERIDDSLPPMGKQGDHTEPVTSGAEAKVVIQPEVVAGGPQSLPPAPDRPEITNVWSIVWKLLAALGFGALGIFALSLISHQMNVVTVVRSLNPEYILAAVILIFLEIVFQALRLQAILHSVSLRIPFRTCLLYTSPSPRD